ncbi:MAG TPA: N-acetylmuramic acid 6-phosphate etherase, partial [Cytophaga sp.]|nr:N-acetylmuramic acid 6-phosphate etherase [Cytophaga sp.]
VIGIAASGRTPYVIGGLKSAKEAGINTGCIVCNPGSAVAAASDFPVEVVTGPEFVTGSTRMKAGTAQKLALNMISTAVMIQLGKVKGNKMVDMQLSNLKLVDRGVRMIMDELSIDAVAAKKLLEENGNNVRNAINAYNGHA